MVGRRSKDDGTQGQRNLHKGPLVLAIVCLLLIVLVSVAYVTARPADKHDAVAPVRGALVADGTPPEPDERDDLVRGPWRLALWLTLLGLITAGWLALGRAFSKSWRAILIGRSNRLSLSQSQFILWTLLFSSAVLAVLLMRVRGLPGADGLGVSVPIAAGGLLGISALSYGGAAAIHANKRRQEPDPRDLDRVVRRRIRSARGDGKAPVKMLAAFAGDDPAKQAEAHADFRALDANLKGTDLGTGLDAAGRNPRLRPVVDRVRKQLGKESEGLLARNEDPRDAGLLNLVQGDEILNRDSLDLGKVQMAGFTLLAIVAYAIALGRFFLDGVFYAGNGPGLPSFDALPAISDGVVALLGASQAGYLGVKGAGATRGVA